MPLAEQSPLSFIRAFVGLMCHLVCVQRADPVLFWSAGGGGTAKEKRTGSHVQMSLGGAGEGWGQSWVWKQPFDGLKPALTTTLQCREISMRWQLSCPSAKPSDCFCYHQFSAVPTKPWPYDHRPLSNVGSCLPLYLVLCWPVVGLELHCIP